MGAASFFAAAAKVPLASIVMVVELTGGYSLLIPTTLSVAIAYMLSGRMSIYAKQRFSREKI